MTSKFSANSNLTNLDQRTSESIKIDQNAFIYKSLVKMKNIFDRYLVVRVKI